MGSLERKKFLDQEKRCAEAIEKRKQKHLEERELAFEKLRKSNIKATFTEEESKSAFDKFSLLAIGHDVYNSDALHVKKFQRCEF